MWTDWQLIGVMEGGLLLYRIWWAHSYFSCNRQAKNATLRYSWDVCFDFVYTSTSNLRNRTIVDLAVPQSVLLMRHSSLWLFYSNLRNRTIVDLAVPQSVLLMRHSSLWLFYNEKRREAGKVLGNRWRGRISGAWAWDWWGGGHQFWYGRKEEAYVRHTLCNWGMHRLFSRNVDWEHNDPSNASNHWSLYWGASTRWQVQFWLLWIAMKFLSFNYQHV